MSRLPPSARAPHVSRNCLGTVWDCRPAGRPRLRVRPTRELEIGIAAPALLPPLLPANIVARLQRNWYDNYGLMDPTTTAETAYSTDSLKIGMTTT